MRPGAWARATPGLVLAACRTNLTLQRCSTLVGPWSWMEGPAVACMLVPVMLAQAVPVLVLLVLPEQATCCMRHYDRRSCT